MYISRIINNRVPFYVNDILNTHIKNKIRPKSYGEYLKTEKKRDKNKRIEVIKKWYNYIFEKKN